MSVIKSLFLQFSDRKVETVYREKIAESTLSFCRIAWLTIPILGIGFAFLDRQVFSQAAPLVLSVRITLIVISLIVFGLTFIRKIRRLMVFSSGLFITLIGIFSIFLLKKDTTSQFSLYFLGIFLGFAGVFTTSGMGFRPSALGMLLNVVVFNIIFGFIFPMPPNLFIVYDFFLISMTLIFGYAAYLVEKVSRTNFLVTHELKESLAKVKQLNGLLPICSSCKKIRDDQGYWNSVETYISRHAEVDFTHSMCPECAAKYYPNLPDSSAKK